LYIYICKPSILYLHKPIEPVQVEMLTAEKGTIENTISESGKLEFGEQQTIESPKENATVDQVKVTPGQKIKDGETLIVLRDRDTQEQEQEQKLENTKSLLTQEKNRKQVSEAQKKVKKAEALVEESSELFKKGYIAESELEEDREQLESAKSELNDAQLEFDSAMLDMQNSQTKLANIQQKLGDRLVTSPINGMVLNVQIKNGAGIDTESKLLTIGDPNREIVKLRLTTLNVSKVKLNQAARVSVIGPNSQVHAGRVISLLPIATEDSESDDSTSSYSESSSPSDGSARVNATVLLNKPSKTIIPGSQVNIEIIFQQRKNVVTLPLEALQGNGNNSFVWVKDGHSE
jgi:HlyD family secretion protein